MLQSLVRFLLPTQCGLCDALTDVDRALCPECWSATQFIVGPSCHCCGAPMVGDASEGDHCDACLVAPKPWGEGRAAFVYSGAGRKLVMALKHGDRLDLIPTLAPMLYRRGQGFWDENAVLVPVPLHWTRQLKRRYNQAAELALGVARLGAIATDCEALVRVKKTASTQGKSFAERQTMLADAIMPNPKRPRGFIGKSVVLVDDVMTTGATLSACTHAAFAAGASRVRVLTLARAVKDH